MNMFRDFFRPLLVVSDSTGLRFYFLGPSFPLLCENALCVEVGDAVEGSEGGNPYLVAMGMEFLRTLAENY